MYIALENNENTEIIIEGLKKYGEEIEVRKYDHATYVDINTSYSSTIYAFANIKTKKVYVGVKEVEYPNYFEISFDDLLNVYSL